VPSGLFGEASLIAKDINKSHAEALAKAIAAVGTSDHLARLIDLIAATVSHDRVTVVRYSRSERPEFVAHRNYSDAMVRKYLDTYYVHDPFYAHWRRDGRPGVVALRHWHDRRGPYIAEFLSESVIRDELGVLLDDGGGWCLGIFLDRSRTVFSTTERQRLETQFPVFAAIHALDIGMRARDAGRQTNAPQPGREPVPPPGKGLPQGLWPSLSAREKQLVQLILAGHPPAAIAIKLKIAPGTVKNHRRRIYDKLDITTERELFLQYMDFRQD
jgi:DNA-binding CsgD family transcriptional regulator